MDNLQFSENAWRDFSYWLNQDKRILNRIMKLFADIQRNGYQGIGKPEPLSGDLSGYWSRRIDEKNALFIVSKMILSILSNAVPIIMTNNLSSMPMRAHVLIVFSFPP